MNHIARLTNSLNAAQAALQAKGEVIQAFRVHLNLDKFRGFDRDGNPKEWIATRDVLAWLTTIADAGGEA